MIGVGGIVLQHVGLGEGSAAALYVGEHPVAAFTFDGFDSVGELLLIYHEKLLLPGTLASPFCTFIARRRAKSQCPFVAQKVKLLLRFQTVQSNPEFLRRARRGLGLIADEGQP